MMKIINLKIFRVPLLFILAVAAIFSLWETYLFLWFRTEIMADGQSIVAHTRSQTVGGLLRLKQITVGPQDIVSPALDQPVPPRGTIRITRVREVIEDSDVFLPFQLKWKKRMTENLRPVELQRGIQKRRIRKIRIVYHDGVEVERAVLKEREISKSVYRLVLIGKDDCIEHVYDLSSCKKINMVATAYYPGDPLAWRDGTVTFLGLKMQRGIVAVDPKVIPLRSRVFVSNYGYGYAGDTGSAIKGKRIDLGVNNVQEEKAWMHRKVTVYILGKSDKW